MRKFKVGDIIIIKKVTPDYESIGIRVGDTGTIVEKDYMHYDGYRVKMDRLHFLMPLLIFESQMEHLVRNTVVPLNRAIENCINSMKEATKKFSQDPSPSPDNPQEIKFPSIGELDISNCLGGYVKINSDAININSDSIDINVEKEKNNMEILDLYKERKFFKIKNDFLINKDEILEEDEIQKIFKEMINQVNVILENEGSKPVDMELPIQYKEFRTAKTNEKLNKLEADRDRLLDKVCSDYEEVKALLSMTNDYQEQIKILKNYGIIDKKTNKLSV